MVEEPRSTGDEGSPEAEAGLSENEFEELIDQSFAEREPGQVVIGRIVRVTPEDVVIDVGSKSEGVVPFQEFLHTDEEDRIFVGQEVEVMVVQPESAEGSPVLSRRRAVEQKAHRMVEAAYETGEGVPCRVESITRGGLRVDVSGLKGFIPFSQSGVRRGHDDELQELVGTQIRAKVIEMRGKGDLVLSRRAHLDDERRKKKEETLAQLEPGARVTGVVKSLTNFGAFVDLGGLDGLVHVSDLSWEKVNHPSQIVQIGETVELVVREIDGDKVSLSLKHLSKDPWQGIAERYPEGTVVRGTVTGTPKYGAFVELEPGVEGLVHISELSWTRRIKKPSEVVKKGEPIEVKVLNVDPDRRRISLGYRQTLPDPWEIAAEKYSKLDSVEGTVSGLTDYGVFVRLPEGIDGMVHVSDISWTKKITNPADVFQKGQIVRVVILDIDPEKRRISLGMKQTESDPWKAAASIYHVGTNVEVKVVKLTDFGVFVELPDGLEGLVHISELSRGKVGHPSEVVNEGDRISMKIIKFDPRKRKLSLSLRQYTKEQERNEVETYLSSDDSGVPTLGDMIGRAIQEKKQARREAEKQAESAGQQAEAEPAESPREAESETAAAAAAEAQKPETAEPAPADETTGEEAPAAAEEEPEPEQATAADAGTDGSGDEESTTATEEQPEPEETEPAAEVTEKTESAEISPSPGEAPESAEESPADASPSDAPALDTPGTEEQKEENPKTGDEPAGGTETAAGDESPAEDKPKLSSEEYSDESEKPAG